MEPIISPWFIYFIHLADNFITSFTVLAILCGLGLLGAGIVFLAEQGELEEDVYSTLKKWIRRFFIVGLMSVLVATFIPSKTTLIGMVIADNVTYNNVEKAIDAGKSVKEELKKDMLDLIEAIQNKDEIEAEGK